MFEAECNFTMQFFQFVGGQCDKVEKENHVAASREKLRYERELYLKFIHFPRKNFKFHFFKP